MTATPPPPTCADLTPASWLCEQVGRLSAPPPPPAPLPPPAVLASWWADPVTWLALAVVVLGVALLVALWRRRGAASLPMTDEQAALVAAAAFCGARTSPDPDEVPVLAAQWAAALAGR